MGAVEDFSIKGFYDSHIHCGPDVTPRCGDDVSLAQGARDNPTALYFD